MMVFECVLAQLCNRLISYSEQSGGQVRAHFESTTLAS